jgi:ABC-type glycerol-3-phosphate transport system permease component
MIEGADPPSPINQSLFPKQVRRSPQWHSFTFSSHGTNPSNRWGTCFEKERLYPISVGIGDFVTTLGNYPGRSAATAVLAMLLPSVIFFLAQRQFMQGVVSK